MDGERFDAMARLVAARFSRRHALRALVGGLVGSAAALVARAAGAEPERRCPAMQTCGEICCPPESTGCTAVTTLPDGTVLPTGCLCPEGVYDREQNACVCPTTCESFAECCGGKVCCAGTCAALDDCVCPPRTACSGTASCERCGTVYTTRGTCCTYPNVGYCCADSAPGAGDGLAICCTPGVDCPPCPKASAWGTTGSPFGCRGEPSEWTDDCCVNDLIGGDVNLGQSCCIPAGHRCDGQLPCCGACADGTCVCLQAGEACSHGSAECCAGLVCNAGFGTGVCI